MEFSYSQLKQKEVINTSDGSNLGKVSDILVSFPENNWVGITVPGCKGFKFTNKREQFISINQIVKVGEDTILVKCDDKNPPPPPKKCPPPPCPPNPCPPNPCPPGRPSQNHQNNFSNSPDRRDYGEYE